ncbi:hypothetical protein TWF192_009586 [Orbilia oligospora]|uniref:Histone H1 n=1 Tax=Orbilia oligospora TaxID=2813651 RepID=A0A6G1LZI5_ORBOL|nr:hypothetical protein TWF679_006266 [Orbilia oligospora]KAF3221930.1 hypothetical protein TWF191_006977 [Orbilia oligospora]KAF3240049.1 hypothetical protein TWF192_009586 [Orbilia oligospora]
MKTATEEEYLALVKESLADEGRSRWTISTWIKEKLQDEGKYLGLIHDKRIKAVLRQGIESGDLVRPNGPLGYIYLSTDPSISSK